MNIKNYIYRALLFVFRDACIKFFANRRFLQSFGRLPSIDRSSLSFSEAIYHRKIYDRDLLLPIFADKVEVKRIVSLVLGSDWVIPTLYSGDFFPSRKDFSIDVPCVIKANHGSGWNYFVSDPKKFDFHEAKSVAQSWLTQRYGIPGGEWLYSFIPPKILVEPWVGSLTEAPMDYKFFVFKGVVRYIQVDTDRASDHKRCFFNPEWEKQKFSLGYPLEERDIPRPISLASMISAAERLAGIFSFARVDFYEIDAKPLFGEITFYPGSGLEHFSEVEFDYHFGDFLK